MRLFIAINFPENVKNELERIIGDLRWQGVDANFSRTENFHLTLAFLGEVESDEKIRNIMNMVSKSVTPFRLMLSDYGSFRDIFWVGLAENKDLSDYVSQLRKELKKGGFEVDDKKFKPHITIARRVKNIEKIKINVSQKKFMADRVSLMKSERINGKLVYTEIFSVSLS